MAETTEKKSNVWVWVILSVITLGIIALVIALAKKKPTTGSDTETRNALAETVPSNAAAQNPPINTPVLINPPVPPPFYYEKDRANWKIGDEIFNVSQLDLSPPFVPMPWNWNYNAPWNTQKTSVLIGKDKKVGTITDIGNLVPYPYAQSGSGDVRGRGFKINGVWYNEDMINNFYSDYFAAFKQGQTT